MTRRSCRVLVVDDEPAMREVLHARLDRWGFDVRTSANAETARALVSSFQPHVVISDLVLPDATGLTLLETLRGENPDRVILLITAYGTIDAAVAAIKAGATDFLTKPLDYVALRHQLEAAERALQEPSKSATVPEPKARVEQPAQPPVAGGMVGKSPVFLAMLEQIRQAASSEAPVLIVGESGSGKELVARTIHQFSARNDKPYVAINAAAVPEALAEGEFFGFERGAFTGANAAHPGIFEQARGGTLFLDEVTEMSASLQPKFLRVLEDGKVRRLGATTETHSDARIVTATNRDPAQAIAEGRFRRDLMYRLDVLRVVVPPLRDRPEDIPSLVEYFLQDCRRRYGKDKPQVSSDALRELQRYTWPGNIRELRNVVERAFVAARAGVIEAGMVDVDPDGRKPEAARTGGIVLPPGITAAEAERILILETLKQTENNKAEAARRLGLDVKTVRNKLKAFDGGGPDR